MVGTGPERVVITGIGAVTPAGCDVESNLKFLKRGESAISRLPRPYIPEVKIGGIVRGFNPNLYLNAKDQRDTHRCVWLAMAAATQAIMDAGYLEKPISPKRKSDEQLADRDYPWLGSNLLARRVGLEIGTAVGGAPTWRSRIRDAKSILRLDPSQAAGFIAEKYDLRGPSYVHSKACAATNIALGEAYKRIRYGEVDAMIAGGSESPFSLPAFKDFNRMRILSTRNDEPEKASRPLDRDRDGIVISEGAAMYFLESYDRAAARGAHIYVEIIGFGHITDTSSPFANNKYATEEAMRMAIESSGLDLKDLNHVSLHAAGTDGDVAEVLALRRVFGSLAERIWVSTPKSFYGHSQGAAAAMAVLQTILEMENGVVFANPNQENPIEEAVGLRLPREMVTVQIGPTLVNGIGLHGPNATLLLAKAA